MLDQEVWVDRRDRCNTGVRIITPVGFMPSSQLESKVLLDKLPFPLSSFLSRNDVLCPDNNLPGSMPDQNL